MTVKKRRTPAQIAATKKLVALNKSRKRKPATRKKKTISARSQVTKKPPTKRLRKRREANTKKGYFPNPKSREHTNYFIISETNTNIRYYDGEKFGAKKDAAIWHSEKSAMRIAQKLADFTGKAVGVYPEKKR